MASQAAVFTGLYPHNTGAYSFDDWSHQKIRGEDLSNNGYHCVHTGEMHMKPPLFDNTGFHERKKDRITWETDDNLHSDIFIGDMTVEWITHWNQEKPLFMQFGFTGPHEPCNLPQRFPDLYNDTESPERLICEGDLNSKPPQHLAHQSFFISQTEGQSQINLQNALMMILIISGNIIMQASV